MWKVDARSGGLWLGATLALVLAGLAPTPGCHDVLEERVLHRSACEVCHKPLDATGTPHGIEDAHPGVSLSCTDCHGGKDRVCTGEITGPEDDPLCSGEWVYDIEESHVSPGDGPSCIKNLSGEKLDAIALDYVRFINPGDLRVAADTCGRCHADVVDRVQRSTMTHTSGEVTVARYRAGRQATPHGEVAAIDVTDPEHRASDTCASESYGRFAPEPLETDWADPLDAPTVAEAQDQYMVKSCFRCHLSDFGENRFEGDYRSSGCTACHMSYLETGFYAGGDPWIDKQTVPHAERHELTRYPTTSTCTTCHYRGGRIGASFQGYRESSGAGLNPPRPTVLGRGLHGHDAAYYLTDEDDTNDFDETPPDVHFEAGMHCVDCHGGSDVHGDGHLYADTQCAVGTSCEDCHGDARTRAAESLGVPGLFTRDDGSLGYRTLVTGLELDVPQVVDSVTEGHPGYSLFADAEMGIDESGFSHLDEVACSTCHSGWLPSCYGCHVTLDLSASSAYHTTGLEAPGKPSGARKWAVLQDLVLMRDSQGKLAPSMPAERFFMTLVGPDGEVVYDRQPRTFTFEDGRTIAGFGQRAFVPHTTRKRSAFMACDRCHSVGDPAAPENEVLLDLTHGFGTERFADTGCDVTNDDPSCDPVTDSAVFQLDALIDEAGQPLVVVGHPDPFESRPLTLFEIQAMRSVVVPDNPPMSTDIPQSAATDVTWPYFKRVE
ncbi:MAG: cytochrome c3 family protein [Polyangiaceae bacterium]|nr:cytochrome c3 family protein [Polyangiaceae bacterium]